MSIPGPILKGALQGAGAINFGRKLFGVDTVKLNGQLAVNGFNALACDRLSRRECAPE